MMGGDIVFSSEKDKGTCFTFSIKAQISEEQDYRVEFKSSE
jgi:signal transduction histidine kinase